MAKTQMDDKDMLGGGDELNQFLDFDLYIYANQN